MFHVKDKKTIAQIIDGDNIPYLSPSGDDVSNDVPDT